MTKAKLEITAEAVRNLLDYSPGTGIFTRKTARPGQPVGSVAGSMNDKGYIKIFVLGKVHGAHRLAWLYEYGKWPENEIDHINGDKSDNRIANLRDVSRKVNVQNQRRARKSRPLDLPLGVQFVRKLDKYVAEIGANGKRHYLGLFPSADLAHEAYLGAKRKLHEGCTI